MNYLALYRKYRPKELEEVVGQTEIKKILASSIKNGTITHAYLFSGPRGTGKTTMAKILAKMVNCLAPVDGNACGQCDSCKNVLNSNDVIEIDAASNNGVDEIRDLREKANLVPASAKYKVYIIDEVHMLTTQAFNALLKTLEEPPKHVIFVLATTEYYKIPLTITSRCQKFQFNKISDDDIVYRLKEIAELENISIDDDALYEIAKISDGGMRDSINFLDQLRSFNGSNITIADVYNVCGNVSSEDLVKFFTFVRNNDVENATDFFEKMDISGKNYTKFNEDAICFLKDVVLYKNNVDGKYIKYDSGILQKVSDLFSIDDIFYIIDSINKLIDRLKNVSRQSVVVVTNYLLLMNNLNNVVVSNEKKNIINQEKNKKEQSNNKYEMAFDFTASKQELTDSVHFENKEVTENKESDTKKDIEIIDKNKNIVINNAFAVANKNIKADLQVKLERASDYLTDKKFMSVAGILIDTKLEVAGKEYIILSSKNEAIVDKAYNNYKMLQELLNTVLDDKYNFVVVTQNEWSILRNEYISNLNKKKEYVIKDLIVENSLIDESVVPAEPSIVDKLFDLVGEDVIEFK